MMEKRIRTLMILFLFTVVSACGQSTPESVPTATSAPTGTPSPTETPLPTLTSTITPTEVPPEPTGPQAGTTLIHVDGSTLVYIPTGGFEMGGGGKNNPIHNVSLRSYWIQKTEVTRRMYARCLTEGECTTVIEAAVSGFVSSDTAYYDRPILAITHEQAESYCTWIGGRLPTEAEWEFAARGTNGNTYPWGNDEPTCDLLNFNDCVGGATRATNYQADKSPFGVLGMAGNVREWVSDYFDGNYYKNSPSQNPTGPQKGNYYVVRGGGYASTAEDAKAYYRGFLKSAGYEADLGFRCVVDAPQIFAPYCEAAQFTQGVQSIQPVDRCETSLSQLTKDQLLFSGDRCAGSGSVTGGELVSVIPVTPLNYECAVSDPQNFTCKRVAGIGVTSIPVTACVVCSGGSTTDVPALECPLNYKLAEGKDYCEYAGGAFPDYCPPNSTPLNENQCVYQQVQAGSCPVGSYFDKGLGACVTIGQTPRECMDGFNYDFEKACCEVGVSAEYPLCRQDEYYSAEYGCVPLPKPDGIESCETISMQFPTCF